MENSHHNQLFSTDDRNRVVPQIYKEYYAPVCKYMKTRTNNHYLSEDLAQDVFVRLMSFESMLRPETIKSFVFTIAKNILIDFLRRKVKQPECIGNVLDDISVHAVEKTDSRVLCQEIMLLEKTKLRALPKQRKKIYCMSRYHDLTPSEISKALSISKRTVECHLFYGRREIRDYMLKCL
ncbi:MAG TPA: sigma-70 family RNA polymerase sigma factor [Paludibacter sp.]|nr:sigma-70 family RNA polymerase sigma factor [Paludibacter sp.]